MPALPLPLTATADSVNDADVTPSPSWMPACFEPVIVKPDMVAIALLTSNMMVSLPIALITVLAAPAPSMVRFFSMKSASLVTS
jgi:hypothetical protein